MWENYLIDVLVSISKVTSLVGFFGIACLAIFSLFRKELDIQLVNLIWITSIALLIAILIPSQESLELMLLGH